MPRKPRPLERNSGEYRDATLVVIASEDTHAVQHYFTRFRPRRVQFRVLPAEDGRSAPEHIIERLDQFRAEFLIEEDDQLWYCGDTDHWAERNHLPNLLQVLQHCRQSGYQVALSNPCFELWLLLHFSELPPGTKKCEAICDALRLVANGYSKDRGCHLPITTEMIQKAVQRANALDAGTEEIPKTPTTRIFRILNLLILRESIVIG